MKFIPEIVFICAIAIYSIVITRFVPKKYYSLSNLLIALGAISYGLLTNLSPSQLGLTLALIKNGLLVGLALSLPIIIIILVLASNKKLRSHFSETPRKNYNVRPFCYEFFFRIPFGTALSEEVIFRSVLLAMLISNHSQLIAIVASSLLFGFWHVFPTLHTVKNHDPLIEMMDDTRERNIIAVLIAVLTTSTAGILFSLITVKTGSFVASWLIHSAINGFAILGGYLTVWYEKRAT